MSTDRHARLWEQLGAGSGILFVVLILPGIILSAPSGDPTKPASEIARQGAGGYTEIRVGIYLTLVGVFFFLSFLAYLHHYLRGAEGSDGWMASLAYGGGLVAAGVMLISAAIRLAASVVSDYGGDPRLPRRSCCWTGTTPAYSGLPLLRCSQAQAPSVFGSVRSPAHWRGSGRALRCSWPLAGSTAVPWSR